MIDLAGKMLAPQERKEKQFEAPTAKQHKPRTRKLVFRKSDNQRRPSFPETVEVNRPYGERGDFEKVTITLPSDVRALLLDESIRRKKRRADDWPIAAIVREALASYLTRKGE